jgi:hypothetical protein
MSSGKFKSNGHLNGTFTYMGYSYYYTVINVCQIFNKPNDCIWSSIQSCRNESYQGGEQGGIFRIDCKSGTIFSIHSPQSGSYTALDNYINNN